MKKVVLIALLASLLLPAAAFAREAEHKADPKQVELQFAMKHQEMELRQMEANLEFENQMRNLELERKRMEMDHQRKKMEFHGKGGGGGGAVVLLFLFVIHILCAVWVYTDIRARNAGSGIWIVVSLMAGLFGALIYGIIRMGDVKAAEDEAKAGKK